MDSGHLQVLDPKDKIAIRSRLLSMQVLHITCATLSMSLLLFWHAGYLNVHPLPSLFYSSPEPVQWKISTFDDDFLLCGSLSSIPQVTCKITVKLRLFVFFSWFVYPVVLFANSRWIKGAKFRNHIWISRCLMKQGLHFRATSAVTGVSHLRKIQCILECLWEQGHSSVTSNSLSLSL